MPQAGCGREDYWTAVAEHHRIVNYRKPATGILSGAERQLLLEFEQIAESKCQRLRRTDKRKVEAFKAGRVAIRNAYEYGRTLVTNSEPPIPAKRKGIALTTVQQDLVIASATGPWCIMTYVTVDAALGARRGEVLALRWRDLENGRVTIARSLSQNKKKA